MAALSSTQRAYLPEPIDVIQPPDLETDDPNLATVVLPAPPPFSSVVAQRKDYHLKRPTSLFSYLPTSDPGTTYTGLMGGLGLNLVPEDEGRFRKRPRTDKRNYRTSARSLNAATSQNILSPLNVERFTEQMDYATSVRRAESVLTESDDSSKGSLVVNGLRKAKGKGKAKDKAELPVKVNEDTRGASLDAMEVNDGHLNDDHCSSCRSNGGLLYCDGCPRSFHLWCLDPPMDAQDVPEGDKRWHCPACMIRQNPPPRPRRSFFAPLLHQLQLTTPMEFELPEDIRNFFKDVSTGPKGSYQDAGETKIARMGRFNVKEERDAFRIKDRNGSPVLCFKCQRSALPDKDSLALINTRELRSRNSLDTRTKSEDLSKSIVSCDYCSLHWHLDCLDPPLAVMPPAHKKWMCPAHIEHAIPRRRTPRQTLPVTDIMTRNVPNNGNIEVIPADKAEEKTRRMKFDEVHINGRRYRIPERVIVLDFWHKLRRGHSPIAPSGLLGLSSPLTSLSSLDENGQTASPSSRPSSSLLDTEVGLNHDLEAMQAVELLMACRAASVHTSPNERMDTDVKERSLSLKVDRAVQTEPDDDPKLIPSNHKQNDSLHNTGSQEVNLSESPRCAVESKYPRRVTRPRTTNIMRPDPLSRLFKKSSVLSSESANKRMTRSKTTTSYKSPLSSKPLYTDATTTIPRVNTRGSRSHLESNSHTISLFSRTSPDTEGGKRPVSPRPLTTPMPGQPLIEPPQRSTSPESPRLSPIQKVENSTALPPGKSPFKIRIPSAINTAVAAATAAAASRPAISEHPNHGRVSYKQVTSSSTSDSSLKSESFVTEEVTDGDKQPTRVRTARNISEDSASLSLL